MSIQRWTPLVNSNGKAQMYAAPDGGYVLYFDHVAAVASAAIDAVTLYAEGNKERQRAAVEAAKQEAIDGFMGSQTLAVIKAQESAHGYEAGKLDGLALAGPLYIQKCINVVEDLNNVTYETVKAALSALLKEGE